MQELQEKDIEVEVAPKEPDLDEQPELPLEAVSQETAKQAEPEAPAPDPVAEMKAQLEATQRRAAELQAERDRIAAFAIQREREAVTAQGNVLVAQYNEIVSSINQAKGEQARLKRELQEAFETGDGARHAEINGRLAELAVDLRDMDEGRVRIEREAERRRQTAQQPRQTQQPQPVRQPANAFEQQISHLSEPSKQWLRQHPDALTDPTKANRLSILDGAAKYQGLQPDTPAYFAFFERELGYARPSDARPTARPTNYAAPVSRDYGNPARPSQVRLTAAERELAKDWGMSDVEYARNKIEAAQQPWSIHKKG